MVKTTNHFNGGLMDTKRCSNSPNMMIIVILIYFNGELTMLNHVNSDNMMKYVGFTLDLTIVLMLMLMPKWDF